MLKRAAVSLTVTAFVALSSPAHAQLLNQIPGLGGSSGHSAGGSTSSLLGGLTGGAVPNVGNASTGNAAGILEYCLKHKYLSGNGAASVKDKLLGGVGGGTSNPAYKSGSNGLLETGNGQTVGLGGDGIKQQVTNKACEMMLDRAKSLM